MIAKLGLAWHDGLTNSSCFVCAWVAKLVDAQDLKSWVWQQTYRFDSGPRHHFFNDTSLQWYFEHP